MPAITRSRLEEIRTLAYEMMAAMTRSEGRQAVERVASLCAAVTEVNGCLAEIDEMLLNGLRDEALSMHDQELVAVARLLDVRARPDWVPLHGWLLERGQVAPDPINIEAAEQFAAVAHESEAIRDDLVTLRRLAVERASISRRLAVLRRLRRADPASRVWIESVATHEDARLRELRLAVPQALEAGDIERLAAMSEEIDDPCWDRQPPAELAALAAGAVEARDLAAAAAEAESIAEAISPLKADDTPPSPLEIDAMAAQRQRLLELEDRAVRHVQSLAACPRILALIQARGLDTAVRRTVATAAPNIDRVQRLAGELTTRRDFANACQRLEHLCDHPPAKGGESRWLADLRLFDSVARAACQELPDLTLPILLRERVHRTAAAVEEGERLRRRFWVVLAAGAALCLLLITATIGWFGSRQSEYGRTIRELERLVSESRAGLHLERPTVLDRAPTRYAGDLRVASLADDFDAGMTAEKQRGRSFREKLARHGECLEELVLDVTSRRGRERDWLEAWPNSFVAAATALAEARRKGGLPKQRGGKGDTVALSAAARERFQEEENDLANAEARQAELDRELTRLAQQAFDARLALIQNRIAAAKNADVAGLLSDVRGLRDLARAAKADGLPANAGGQRVPAEALGTLDALETRLRTLDREGSGSRTGGLP